MSGSALTTDQTARMSRSAAIGSMDHATTTLTIGNAQIIATLTLLTANGDINAIDIT